MPCAAAATPGRCWVRCFSARSSDSGRRRSFAQYSARPELSPVARATDSPIKRFAIDDWRAVVAVTALLDDAAGIRDACVALADRDPRAADTRQRAGVHQ